MNPNDGQQADLGGAHPSNPGETHQVKEVIGKAIGPRRIDPLPDDGRWNHWDDVRQKIEGLKERLETNLPVKVDGKGEPEEDFNRNGNQDELCGIDKGSDEVRITKETKEVLVGEKPDQGPVHIEIRK